MVLQNSVPGGPLQVHNVDSRNGLHTTEAQTSRARQHVQEHFPAMSGQAWEDQMLTAERTFSMTPRQRMVATNRLCCH